MLCCVVFVGMLALCIDNNCSPTHKVVYRVQAGEFGCPLPGDLTHLLHEPCHVAPSRTNPSSAAKDELDDRALYGRGMQHDVGVRYGTQ